MSFSILHILSHGSHLSKERGLLRLENKKTGTVREIALEEVRAVIIAARGISLTDALISALAQQKAVILHCDEKYRPVAFTAPVHETIAPRAMEGQIGLTPGAINRIWRAILSAKITNQAVVLRRIGADASYLESRVQSKNVSESACAKWYWSRYFEKLHERGLRRRLDVESPVNACLNYGYAVLSALVHRSILAHGLLPGIGIHHKNRYRSHPLVYDLMEPLRPVIDLALHDFDRDATQSSLECWCRQVAASLQDERVKKDAYTVKMLDAVDYYVESVARTFSSFDHKELWIPSVLPCGR